MDRRDLKKSCLGSGLVILLFVCLLALPAFADGDDETELDSGFVPIGIGVTQPDPEPAEEPEKPAPDPGPEDPEPETGNENETELDSGFVSIGIGVTQPDPEPAEEPGEPDTDPGQEDPDPETGNENETEMSGGFVSIGVGETGPEAGTTSENETVPGPKPNAPAVRFTDVATGKWYAEAVIEAASKGIMNGMGDGTFAPQANLTRAMLVQILYNLEGRPAVSGGAPFGDVPAGAWYAPAVAWAAGEKLVEGYGGNYDPLADITREQLVTVLWRYAKWKGASLVSGGSLEAFADAEEVSSWAAEAMGWAVGVGLINGRSTDTLAPRSEATRAEVAVLMLRFIALTNR